MSNSNKLHNSVMTIVGILAILLTIQYAKAIVVPFLLSLFIALIMAMPIDWLKNRGFSLPVSIGIVLVLGVLLEILLAILLGNTVSQFHELLPVYQERLNGFEEAITAWLLSKGIDLHNSGLLQAMDPKWVLDFANTLMAGLGEVLSNAVLIMFTVMFVLLEAWSFPKKVHAMEGIQGGNVMKEIVKIIDSTKHYIAMKTLMSLATGLLVGIGLSLIGLDFAVLWGFLAFLLNFIPNVGSILAAVPAVLLALLQLGPSETILVIVVYLAANTLIGSIIEPMFMGRRVGLSTLTVFLSLVFWGWLLGPVGMLLSIPLTMLIKFAAETGEQTRWFAVLLSPSPVTEETTEKV